MSIFDSTSRLITVYQAVQLDKISKERRAFIEEASLDDFRLRATRKQYPVGSVWLWTLGAVYGPEGSADSEVSANGRN